MRNPCTMTAIHRLRKTIDRFRHAYRALRIDCLIMDIFSVVLLLAMALVIWDAFDDIGGFDGAGFPINHGFPLIILLIGYLVLDHCSMAIRELTTIFRKLRSRRRAAEQQQQETTDT